MTETLGETAPVVAPPPPDGAALVEQLILQSLQEALKPTPAGQERAPHPVFRFLPGYQQGFESRVALEARKEQLRLAQKRLAGEEAGAHLQRLDLLDKLKQRTEQRGMMEELSKINDFESPEAQQVLQKFLVRTGQTEQLLKFQEAQRQREQSRLLQDFFLRDEDQADAAPGTAPPAAPGTAPPAAPGTAPPATARPRPDKAQYRPLFQQFGRKYNVDPLFLEALAQGEASDEGAVSPKGAEGVMQILPGTAAPYGGGDLKQPATNIERATQYVADLQRQFPNRPDLVAAAYHAGAQAVARNGGQVPQTTDGITRTPAYVRGVLDNYARLRQSAPPSTATREQLRGVGLERDRARLERQLRHVQRLQPLMRGEARKQVDGIVDNLRAALALTETQIKSARGTEAEFDKGFVEYFATRHNGQTPQQAVAAGFGATVQQARAAFDQAEAERKAHEAHLREAQTQPLALERAERARARASPDKAVIDALTQNISVYKSISKVESILREGTDLPPDFLDKVSADSAEVQRFLISPGKELTGPLQQFATRWGATASNDPRINRFLSALANARDLIINLRSGQAVSPTEEQRATGAFDGSLPSLGQAFSRFVENLSNVRELVLDRAIAFGAVVYQSDSGQALFGTLPPEIRRRVVDADRVGRGETLLPGVRSIRKAVP